MKIPSRGAAGNPPNRFERLTVELDSPAERNPRTRFLREESRSIISRNDSPDISFSASLNPYRGCEHGCSYCYARPYHEYLGFSSGIDFETRIIVKENAADLLREQLESDRWTPEVLALSTVTDCYQPVERRLEITRRCLRVLADFRNPVGIITKNHLVTRDADILSELADFSACSAHISITSLDPDLSRRMEPRASMPAHRLDAIAKLTQAGIPVGVVIAPVIPGLTDHEIPAILKAAREAGAVRAAYSIIRLPHAVKEIFSSWLQEHVPGSAGKILDRIRDIRGGALHSAKFGERLRGRGFWAGQIGNLFSTCREKEGFASDHCEYNLRAFRRPEAPQMNLGI
ncbi:MAG: PA0069 family radical SAM protein [Verrucomicrobiaceae bacterium]|nr:MAG: PA0069 family radical SAM protein [Verrucomicrobiaceae bacterium]